MLARVEQLFELKKLKIVLKTMFQKKVIVNKNTDILVKNRNCSENKQNV